MLRPLQNKSSRSFRISVTCSGAAGVGGARRPAEGPLAGFALLGALLGAIAGALLLASCGRGPSVSLKGANVVLVVVDTLRSDRLSAYGAKRRFCPDMDRLASEGFTFLDAVAPCTWTKPSVASLMTGRYPGRHGALGNRAFNRDYLDLDPSLDTLAESLKSAGYRTAALVTNPHLLARYGFDQGFDEYKQPAGRAEPLFARASDWVRRNGKEGPFFLYLHVVDPHSPYFPPESFRRKYAPEELGPEAPFARQGEFFEIVLWMDQFRDWRPKQEGERFHFDFAASDWKSRAARIAPNLVDQDLSQAYLDFQGRDDPELVRRMDHLKALYNAETAYTNEALAGFRRVLEEEGLMNDTVFILTSDHGEAFLEHDEWGHGHDVHAEEVSIPLIFRVPAGPKGAKALRGTFREPVSLVDVFPTVVDLLGLPAPAGMDGRSLRPILEGGGEEGWADRPVFSEHITETADFTGARIGRSKLMRTARADGSLKWRYYDLSSDPGEQHPLSLEEASARAASLKQALQDLLANRTVNFKLREKGSDEAPSEEEIRQLRELGYL